MDERTLLGLTVLLEGIDTETEYKKSVYAQCVELDHHPFGLPLSKKDPALFGQLSLLAWPGYTQPSVDAMCAAVRGHFARASHRAPARPEYLRVIYCPGDFGNDVFFEFAGREGGVICGGCTDCSGTGSAGMWKLYSVFQFLAACFDMTVEEVHVEKTVGDAGTQYLKDAYNDYHQAIA